MRQGRPVPTRLAAGADTGCRLTSPWGGRPGWDGGTRTLAPRFKGAGAALDVPGGGRGGRTRTFENLVQGQAPSPLGHAPVGWVDAFTADGLKGARTAGPCPWAAGSSGGLPVLDRRTASDGGDLDPVHGEPTELCFGSRGLGISTLGPLLAKAQAAIQVHRRDERGGVRPGARDTGMGSHG